MSKPLRILYVTDFLPHARSDHGGGKMLRAYMESMRALGHQVSLLALCQPKDAPMVATVRGECASAEIIPVLNTRARRIRSFASGLFEMEARAYCRSVGFHAAARRFLAGREFDVVHIVHPWLIDPVVSAIPAGRRNEIRLIGHVIDVVTAVVRRRLSRMPSPRLLKEYFWATATEFRSYARVDRLLTHTQSDSDMIAARLRGGPPSRVIPVWFDAMSRLLPNVESRPQSARFLVVGTSSDPRMRESVSWLLKHVWPAVSGRFPNATLDLFSVRPEHMGLWSGIPGVVAHSYVDDLPAVYDDACALLFPLRSGGYSRHLKVLNAMARGCPIVMTSEANTAEQLQDGVEALIRDDAAGFAQAMMGLLQSPESGLPLARAALRRVSGDYQDLDLARELMALYSEP